MSEEETTPPAVEPAPPAPLPPEFLKADPGILVDHVAEISRPVDDDDGLDLTSRAAKSVRVEFCLDTVHGSLDIDSVVLA